MPDPSCPPSSAPTCPQGHRCESCGVERPDLTVVVAATAMGPFCWTACPSCAAPCEPPAVTLATARRLVAQHAAHLRTAGGAG